MSASLEKLLSKIKVAFVGDDENLTQEAKKASEKTKKFTAQGYNEGLRELETIKNSDIILCELKNSHSLEFIEDISYENPRVKIIALERISSQNGGGGQLRLCNAAT